jgi:hypothetical protein
MDDIQHLLSKHGVLIEFNIAREMKKTDIDKLRSELKKKCKDDADLNEQLEKLIILNTKKALLEKTIPGLIVSPKKKKATQSLRIPKATLKKISTISTHLGKILEKHDFTSKEVLMLVQFIFNSMGIKNQDVLNFNKEFHMYLDNEDWDFDTDEDDEDFGEDEI